MEDAFVTKLILTEVPATTTNPANQSVCEGNPATFAAAATGTPTPTVQWQVSLKTGTTFTDIPGANSATLTVNPTSAGQDGNQYRAVFPNAAGTTKSTVATLTVNSAPSATTNPSNQIVTSGQTATFTAAALGKPMPTVQWQVSTNGGQFVDIAGQTSLTLRFPVSAAMTGNRYRAVFANTCATATTTPATLTVNTAPRVTADPTSQTVCAGNPVTFTAAASGTPAPTVQWQVSAHGGNLFSNIGGATSPTLTLTVDASVDGNQYRAVFTNSAGSATTVPAMLSVRSGPLVTTNPVSQTVQYGGTVIFTSAATGGSSVQWQATVDSGATFADIPGATSTTLGLVVDDGLNMSEARDGNQYRAVFTNSCGVAITTVARLQLTSIPLWWWFFFS